MTHESPIQYAKRRHYETRRHYIVSNEGHAVMDCRHNRKVWRELGLSIVFTTRP